jgi:GT2 family glycosyltransferase
VQFSVIVPFHADLGQLDRCLAALAARPPGGRVIVVGDGAPAGTRDLAERHGARFIEQPDSRGPAVARNRGAAAADGEVLVFVDSDVVVAPGAIRQLLDRLQADSEAGAVFGAYDEAPDHPGFMSQYRNLAHSYVHQQASSDAQTFWAGLGAVRRQAFVAVGGFDERFTFPSVEDIDLGYRLRTAGYRIVLDHRIRGCHLKRWTLLSSIAIDIWRRGIPWTQLLLRSSRFDNDLNLRAEYRASVVCAYILAISLIAAFWYPSITVSALMVGMLLILNWPYYRFFARRRGLWFAVRVFPLHLLHHLCNGVSVVWGGMAYLLGKAWGIRVPGALPVTTWSQLPALERTHSIPG